MSVRTRAFAALVVVAMSAGLSACRVQHDNPPRPLNAQYHQLSQSVVDHLLKEVPQPPGGSGIYCTNDDMGGYYESYCICYDAKSCGDLAASDRCDAKIGEIRPGIGVCRERIERVVIGQRAIASRGRNM